MGELAPVALAGPARQTAAYGPGGRGAGHPWRARGVVRHGAERGLPWARLAGQADAADHRRLHTDHRRRKVSLTVGPGRTHASA